MSNFENINIYNYIFQFFLVVRCFDTIWVSNRDIITKLTNIIIDWRYVILVGNIWGNTY